MVLGRAIESVKVAVLVLIFVVVGVALMGYGYNNGIAILGLIGIILFIAAGLIWRRGV